MKKVALSLLALAVVAVGAFADAPKWDPKVSTEFKGEASVTLGYDLDTGVAAVKNGNSLSLIVDLVSGGDRTSASDADVWGEIKIKTDGDPVRIKADGVAHDATTAYDNGFKLQVDYAKINFGKNAYLSITSKDTNIGYAAYPDLAFWAGKRSALYGKTFTPIFADKLSAYGQNTAGGAEFGFTVPDVAKIILDAGTTEAWVTDGPNPNKTNVAVKGAVELLFLPDLTLQAGADYTTKENADRALGGKAAYKLGLGGDTFLKPSVGVTLVQLAAKGDYLPVYNAGVLFGLGAKAAAFDNYGMKFDKDWGGNPGVAVGLTSKAKGLTGGAKDTLWLNVSANSGAVVADTSLVGAYEILDLNADKLNSVITVGASSKVVTGDVTISPKGTVNYESDAAVDKTYTYLKATADVTGVIPFVTFTVNYESNDLSDKANTVAGNSKGKFEFTTKISF